MAANGKNWRLFVMATENPPIEARTPPAIKLALAEKHIIKSGLLKGSLSFRLYKGHRTG